MKLKFFVFTLALLVLPSVAFAAGNCTKEGGKDYYTVGTATVEGIGNSTDQCISDKRLLEYYCDEQGKFEYEYYDCDVSCVDGACSGGPVIPPSNETCVESWKCSNWTGCVTNQQTRTCEDLNACNTTLNKPAETQSCGTTTPATPFPGGFAQYRYYIVGGVILLLIVLYFVLKKKEPEVKEPEKKEEEKK